MKKIIGFPKPKRQPLKKWTQRQADSLFSEYIRKSRGTCQAAGKDTVKCGGYLQCAHIITRARSIIRYDENNALCLCAGHHAYYTNNPYEWFEIFIPKNFFLEWMYVKRKALIHHDRTQKELRSRCEALHNKLATLQIKN